MSDAPLNSAYLGMGRQIVPDRDVLESEGVQPSVIDALMGLQGLSTALGYAGASEGDDNQRFQNIIGTYDTGTATWSLFAGRPDTPLDPDSVSILSGGTAIIVERNNVSILAVATTINFSTLFTVTDAGAGQADVGITTAQTEIWGLDPAGGHTLVASAPGTLTLNLKIVKQTITVFSVDSSVQDDIDIVYSTGDAC